MSRPFWYILGPNVHVIWIGISEICVTTKGSFFFRWKNSSGFCTERFILDAPIPAIEKCPTVESVLTI